MQAPTPMNPDFAGILYSFAAWMTVQPNELCFGAQHEATVAVDAVDAINKFAAMQGFVIEGANVSGWKDAASQQAVNPQPVGHNAS